MTIKHAILFIFLQKKNNENKLWKKNEQLCFGAIVWLVLHDFYSNNIWFTSRTLSNGSKNIAVNKIISYCVIKETTLYFSKVK
jgi:hypothetical protein